MSTVNHELDIADQFLCHTDCTIFLTGNAGTGKTTFLKALREKSAKRMVITAPTGVAAINAGGVTLHSFFQIPFSPFLPGSGDSIHDSQRRFSKEKINIIRSLDLLVIDEISMVRADVLDCVDAVLRRYRHSNMAFGGVQLLMIGDLYQLPPVVKEAEWQILHRHYQTVYFFSSNALSRTEMISIELKHIYRQSDRHFIDLLNSVRENRADAPILDELNRRYLPGFVPDDGCITLCSHNSKADAINASRLQAIERRAHRFEAAVEGNFPEHTFPTYSSLELKVGAQVMFMRNDSSADKRYFNGKIGRITKISDEQIWIQCPGENSQIIVEPVSWENIEYTLDEESGEIKEKIIGTFEQYPLKPAWAITIHKSQGLTFDRAVIDAEAAFTHGQVYVALSRCRTLEGMVLSSPLSSRSMKTDPSVLRFTKESRLDLCGPENLASAKIRYQQRLLLECFDFQRLASLLAGLVRAMAAGQGLLHVSGVMDIGQVQKDVLATVCRVGENFKRQLQGLFANALLPAEDPLILERIASASTYFEEKLDNCLLSPLSAMGVESDNKDLAKKIKKAVKQVVEEGNIRRAGVKSCSSGFSPSTYLRGVSAAQIEVVARKAKVGAITYTEADIDHPQLFQTLRQWRTQKAGEENVAPFQILHQKTLVQITVNLPDTMAALLKIRGIGKRLAERYGEEILKIVTNYREERNIKEVVLPTGGERGGLRLPTEGRSEVAIEKKPTREISLEMFERGVTPVEIARERGLTVATIEGHLAFYIASGHLQIEKLLTETKKEVIAATIEKMANNSFKEIKDVLGSDYSYGDIKFVYSHLSSLKKV